MAKVAHGHGARYRQYPLEGSASEEGDADADTLRHQHSGFRVQQGSANVVKDLILSKTRINFDSPIKLIS